MYQRVTAVTVACNLSVLGDGCEAGEFLLGDDDPVLLAGCHELVEGYAAVSGAVRAIEQLAEGAVLPSVLDVSSNN